jgi:outer membrane protein assembly factor BamD
LLDKYPLYSHADESLYLLGQAYEGEIAMVRSRPGNEAAKARMIQEFTKDAGEAYSRILTRYPLMERTEDAKARLEALHLPVPKPTKAAVALNKAEEDSRRETSTVSKVMRNFQKHPDVAQATRVGEPTLVDPQVVSATSVVQDATRAMIGAPAVDKNGVAIETVNKGALAPDQPAPRSDAPSTPADSTGSPSVGAEIIGTGQNEAAAGAPAPGGAATAAPADDANELKPNVAADPNELKPNVDNAQPAPAPTQVNEIQPGDSHRATPASTDPSAAAGSAPADDKDVEDAMSSSRHKKKKGLRKVVPF